MPVATNVDADDARVTELLGRRPAGRYEVVVRDGEGSPVVIRNAPLLDDGTPMPTRYWLVGRDEVAAVSRLEASGGVRTAEAAVDASELAAAHARYATERDAEIPTGAEHRPSGGVGGTRQGVKCLHAHYAWHLAGGDDPVGRWVAEQLSSVMSVDIAEAISVRYGGGVSTTLPTMLRELLVELGDADPPSPQALTNAIGAISDDVDNLMRERPDVGQPEVLELTGAEAWHLAVVERGEAPGDAVRATLGRDALEDLFRTLATERRSDRLHNPELLADRVDSILATCCAVLAIMRRLQFGTAAAIRPTSPPH